MYNWSEIAVQEKRTRVFEQIGQLRNESPLYEYLLLKISSVEKIFSVHH